MKQMLVRWWRGGLIAASLALAAPGLAWTQTVPIVAIADVHGAHDEFLTVLRAARLVDSDGRWKGGRTRLVLTGDLIDRGAGSRAVLDLVMRLEGEAPASGGKVYFLLGNHEVMNLLGDLRTTMPVELAAYAAEEDPAERAAAFAEFKRRPSDKGDVEAVFERAYPPGYFGHRRAFAPEGVYGRWLLAHSPMLSLDGVLFMHGGMAPSALDQTPEAAGHGLRAAVLAWRAARDTLIAAGGASPIDSYGATNAAARTLIGEPGAQGAAARALLAEANGPWLGRNSPTWYRGAALCSALGEEDRLANVVERHGVQRLVVGHTSTLSGWIEQRWDGRLIRLDTGVHDDRYRGPMGALVLQAGGVLAIGRDGVARPMNTTPLTVGLEDLERPPAWLAACLERASPVAVGVRYQLDCGGVKIAARFVPDDGAPGGEARRELAAFRLSELAGYGGVPMTVERALEGRRGVMRHVPAGAEGGLATSPANPWCDVEVERRLARGFDWLIAAPERPLASAGLISDGRVALWDNAEAFSAPRVPCPREAGLLFRRPIAPGAARAQVSTLLTPAQMSALEWRLRSGCPRA